MRWAADLKRMWLGLNGFRKRKTETEAYIQHWMKKVLKLNIFYAYNIQCYVLYSSRGRSARGSVTTSAWKYLLFFRWRQLPSVHPLPALRVNYHTLVVWHVIILYIVKNQLIQTMCS